eukprot:NODE_200_length_2714_cov_191.579049_g186_i0.p1 GENE.NODE_200_length_2714_cov_191.579049_g186_i0~~NODE_200_length_2714_cov_191.579049_g186_i0.p1  ORF type:complete len:856 (-),score=166.84 NODE_200_length_2714_cov_191.579049_g186_i0:69-2636(-)
MFPQGQQPVTYQPLGLSQSFGSQFPSQASGYNSQAFSQFPAPDQFTSQRYSTLGSQPQFTTQPFGSQPYASHQFGSQHGSQFGHQFGSQLGSQFGSQGFDSAQFGSQAFGSQAFGSVPSSHAAQPLAQTQPFGFHQFAPTTHKFGSHQGLAATTPAIRPVQQFRPNTIPAQMTGSARIPSPKIPPHQPETKKAPIPTASRGINPLSQPAPTIRSSSQGVQRVQAPSGPEVECTMRVLTVNDVYKMENLARFKTFINQHRTPNTIVTLPGDFLAPSLLSAIDKGRAMVDVLNMIPLDYVCVGNHESNVGLKAFQERYKESKFVWLNTNMPDVDLGGLPKMPEYVLFDVKGESATKRVGLIGLDTDDMLAYPPGAFGGAKIHSVLETAKIWKKKLENQCDLIIPMTHLRSNQDIELANLDLGFPIMLAAHDHFLFHRIVKGQHIFKLGQDATHLGMIDIIWHKGKSEPIINCTIHDAQTYAPDPEIAQRIEEHGQVVEQLRGAHLAVFPPGVHMSSVPGSGGERGKKGHTIGRFLATAGRPAMGASLCLVVNGCMRGFIDYKDRKFFTYAHLIKELPGDVPMVVLPLPGKLLCDMVEWSRGEGYKSNPGAFLHVDHEAKVNEETNQLTHIMGEPVDPNRKYHVALNFKLFCNESAETFNIKPLIEYKAKHPEEFPESEEAGGGRSLQVALVEYWSGSILMDLVKGHTLDKAGKGYIDRNDLLYAIDRAGHYTPNVAQLMVDNILAAADSTGKGRITRGDLLKMAVKTSDWPADETGGSHPMNANQVRGWLETTLGEHLSDEDMTRMMKHLDPTNSGQVTKGAMYGWVANHRAENIGVLQEKDAEMLQLPDMMMAKTH